MIVKLRGGCGNQLFQYAFGRSESARRGCELSFVLGTDLGASGYALDKYAIDVPPSTKTDPYFTYEERGFPFDPEVANQPDGVLYDGFWQTEKYFDAALIRRELSTPEQLGEATRPLCQLIDASNSVFVHVRRGDNLAAGSLQRHGNLMETDYYDKAIAYMREKVEDPTFIVFSDGPTWCDRNFRPEPSVVVAGNQPHEDIYLMSRCKHGIIANSTFSWWGAWLGERPGREIVAPKRWFTAPDRDAKDIVPTRWVSL